MKISVLIENTAKCGFACEHGLSLLIEHNGENILLDSGKSGIFADNARKMGVDLAKVDYAFLSHGHYDHAGGFNEFFRQNDHARVYLRREAMGEYYSVRGGLHEIGIPEAVKENIERFEFIDTSRELSAGVYAVGRGEMTGELTGDSRSMRMRRGDDIVQDDLRHEHSLVIDTPRGLVVFNSCSHGGVGRIIAEVREYCGERPIYAYVGGLHMMNITSDGAEGCGFTDDEVDELCRTLKREVIARLYTGHCTGQQGFAKLKERLGESLYALSSGEVFTL